MPMNEHFDDRKIRTEAAKKFLDDLNARQEEDMRKAIEKSAEDMEAMKVDIKKLLKNMKRWIRLYMKRHNIQEQDIHALFEIFDENGDGVISRQEFSNVLMRKLDLHFNEVEVIEIISYFDANNDGYIDYSEFCNKIVEQKVKYTDQNVDAFIASIQHDQDVITKAAVTIQKSFRGLQGRQAYNERLVELLNEEEKRQLEKETLLIRSHEESKKSKQSTSIRTAADRRHFVTNSDGSTRFHELAYFGKLEELKQYISLNESSASNLRLDPFTLNNYGETCLHIAAAAGNTHVCLYLIEVCGLSVKSKTYFGHSAVDYAERNGNDESLQLLLKYV